MVEINLNSTLGKLQYDINRIVEYEINKDNTENIIGIYLIELEQLFNRYTVNGEILKYLVNLSVTSSSVILKFRTKLKDKVQYSNNIIVDIDNDEIFKIIKRESFIILKQIFKAHLAEYYIQELNSEVLKIAKNCDMYMCFDLSDSIIKDISDKCVVFGLSVEQALNIPRLYLFDKLNGCIYFNTVREQLRICQTPAQLVKYDNEILKDLGVYTRSRFEILLRSTYSRKYQYLGKSGVGYIHKDGIIALVEVNNEGEKLKLSPIDLRTYLYTGDNLGFK